MTAPTAPAQQREAGPTSAAIERLRHAGGVLALPVGSVILALVIGAVIIVISGGDPVASYQAMACGGVGLFCFGGETPAQKISDTIVFIIPLILAGLAVAVAFRAGLFNIGVQGQLIIGAILATIAGIKLASLPAILLIPLVLLLGMLGGAIWAGIAGVLKALTGAHEVVTTIMLNYVSYNLLRYLLVGGGPLQSPVIPATSIPVGQNAQLPTFVPRDITLFGQPGASYYAGYGIFVSLAAAALYAFLMQRTALGYEIRAVGQSQRAARYAGISVRRTLIVTMLISGAFAGLIGAVMISGGSLHTLQADLANDSTGFDGIAVSLLGQNVAVGVILAAALFGALHDGGNVMQSDVHIDSHIIQILTAVVLISLAANVLRTVKIRIPSPGQTPAATELPEPTAPQEMGTAAVDVGDNA